MSMLARKWRMKLAALILTVLLVTPGCTTTVSGVTSPPMSATLIAEEYCSNTKPILWSKDDTVETVRQAKEHNRVYRALCNPKT